MQDHAANMWQSAGPDMHGRRVSTMQKRASATIDHMLALSTSAGL